MGSRLPKFIQAWLALDLILALFPPVHWVMSGSDPILGVPRALLYIYGTGFIVALSIIATYFADRALWPGRAGDR